MKKYAWMLALALPVSMAFVSCGNDDDEKNTDPDNNTGVEITLDASTSTLNYKDSVVIKASVDDVVWESDNKFVATVNNGVVKGLHVGEATITAVKDGQSASCKVTVKATNSDYELPVMDWGATQDFVKSNWKMTLDEANSDATILFYTAADGAFPWYTYTFTDNALDASSFTVALDDELVAFDKVAAFLDQYYAVVATDDDTMTTTYANASTLADATVVCNLKPIGENLDMLNAAFVPYKTSKGVRSVNDVNAALARHRAIISKIQK